MSSFCGICGLKIASDVEKIFSIQEINAEIKTNLVCSARPGANLDKIAGNLHPK